MKPAMIQCLNELKVTAFYVGEIGVQEALKKSQATLGRFNGHESRRRRGRHIGFNTKQISQVHFESDRLDEIK